MSYTPKISVVIISYNFVKFIGECIESILAQTLQPYEIVIYDDCSTDGSWDVIREYSLRYPNLIVAYRHSKNVGMIENGNTALRSAKGDLISWMDGDDRWLPQKLELEWAAICASPTAKVAYSSVYITDEVGNRTSIWHGGESSNPPTGDVFVQTFAKRFFLNCRSVFRNFLMYRSALEELDYHDHDIALYIDWDLKIRIAARYQFAYSGAALMEYRMHSGGAHNRPFHHHYEDLVKIYNKNLPLLENRCAKEISYVQSELQGLAKEYGGVLPIQSKFTANGLPTANTGNLPRNSQKDDAADCKGENLIFLISAPRSGSTLLQQLLASHTDIHTTEEPWVMLHPLYALKRQGVTAEYESHFARQALDGFLSRIPEGEDAYIESLRAMANILYKKALDTTNKSLFLDKTPRYLYILPELFKVFPKAKFVVLLRNPAAVLSSVLRTWFNNDLVALKENRHYFDLIQGPKLINEGLTLLNNNAIAIHYENLVRHPEKTIRDICQYIDIPFETNMLNYNGKQKPNAKFGDPLNVHKHDSPVASYLETWQSHLNKIQLRNFAIDYIDSLGEDTIQKLGYSIDEIKNGISHGKTIDAQEITDKSPNINSALTLNTEGENAFNNNNIDIAEEKFKQANNLATDNIDILNNLVVVYWYKQDFVNAIKTLAHALSINPHHRNITLNGGQILQALDKKEDAKNLYTSYLKIYPDDDEIRNLASNINQIDHAIDTNLASTSI